MVKFPTCGAFHADFMDYPTAVAVLGGCCLPDCHCKRIVTARELGRAITIGSTAVHGGTIRVTLPKIAWEMPGGFCFCCMEERCPKEPDDCTGDYAQNDTERT